MTQPPKRDTPALIEALRIRALALTGEAWERTATRDMMNAAAQQLEDLSAALTAARAPHDAEIKSLQAENRILKSDARVAVPSLQIEILNARVRELKAELVSLREQQAAVMHEIQRYQPAGSPPPGGPVQLAAWVLSTLALRAPSAPPPQA